MTPIINLFSSHLHRVSDYTFFRIVSQLNRTYFNSITSLSQTVHRRALSTVGTIMMLSVLLSACGGGGGGSTTVDGGNGDGGGGSTIVDGGDGNGDGGSGNGDGGSGNGDGGSGNGDGGVIPVLNSTPTFAVSNNPLTVVEDFTGMRTVATVSSATGIMVDQSNPGVVTVTTSVSGVFVSSIANAYGQTTFNITATNGTLTASTQVVVIVSAINDTPTLSVSSNVISTIGGFTPITIFTTASDIENGVINITVTESSPSVVRVNTSTNAITLNNIPGASGQTTLTVRAVDSSGTTVTQTIVVNVRIFDSAVPMLEVSTNRISLQEDFTTALVIRTTATDSDGQSIMLSVSSSSHLVNSVIQNPVSGVSIITNLISLTAVDNANGITTLTVQVADIGGESTSVEIVVSVAAVNDPPMLTVPMTNLMLSEDFAVAQSIATITNVDGDTQTVIVTESTTGVVTVTTSATGVSVSSIANANGRTTLTIGVSDSVNSVSTQVAVTVLAVNDTPTFTLSTTALTLTENFASPVSITVTSRDIDGDTLTLSVIESTTGVVTVARSLTEITLSSIASVSGQTTLTISVSDDTLTSTAQVVIQVRAINRSPTITVSTNNILVNAGFSPITINATVRDPEEGALPFSVQESNTGVVSVTTSADTIILTAMPGITGQTNLIIQTSDSFGLTAMQTIFVNVIAVVTTSPVLTVSTNLITVQEDFRTPVVIRTTATDVDGDPIIISVNASMSLVNHVISPLGNGVTNITLIPISDRNGTATLTVRATDPGGLSDSKQIIVMVNAVNDPPALTVSTNLISTSGGFSPITIGTTASDAEERDIGFAVQVSTTGIVGVTTSVNAIVLTAMAGTSGETTLTVVTVDQFGLSATQTISVSVRIFQSIEPMLMVSTDRIIVVEEFTSPLVIQTTATDADGDPITLSVNSSRRLVDAVISTPIRGISTITNTITLTAIADLNGTATLTIQASDAGGESTSVEVVVVVNAVIDPLSFSVATSVVSLSALGNQLNRNVQSITVSNIDSQTFRTQWQVTNSGDAILSTNPAPVVSYTTNRLTTQSTLTAAAHTAQLYFSIIPDRTGTATLTLQLNNLTTSESTQQTMVVHVHSVNVPPMIAQVGTIIENAIVHGGRLYANSALRLATPTVTSYLTDARALGGHLVNLNTIEEFNYLRSAASGLVTREVWYGLTLPQQTFPGELFWVTHDSTIAYGIASTNGATNLTVYPGYYNLIWGESSGLIAHRHSRASTVFNWTVYSPDVNRFFLLDDGGFITNRQALYEFPQGIASNSIKPVPLIANSRATVRLFGYDLNGDAISTSNWSATPMNGTASLNAVALSTGVQTMDLVYTPPSGFSGPSTVMVTLQVNGFIAERVVSFVVDAPPTIALSTNDITLDEDFSSFVIGTTATDEGISGSLPFSVQVFPPSGLVAITTSANAIRLSSVGNASGQAILTIQTVDSALQNVSTRVFVTVEPVNDPPTIEISSSRVTILGGILSYTIGTTATDIENGALPFSVQASITGLVSITTSANAIELSPILGRTGQTVLTVRTIDQGRLTAVQTIVVDVVIAAGNAPVLNVSTNLIRVQEDFSTSVVISANATDVDGDAIMLSLSSSSRLVNAVMSTLTNGMSTITLSAIANLNGTATLTINAVDSGGLFVSQQIVVVVNGINDDPVSFTFSTSVVTLSALGNQLDRNIQKINISNPDNQPQRLQWLVTSSGTRIFSANPTPVVSFTTNALTTETTLTSVADTAQLYFSITPNQTGVATLTVQLTNLTRSEMSQQTLVVQVNPFNRPPVILPVNSNLQNLVVNGGHLYANSVTTAQAVTSFLAEARALGGHLLNVNTQEESNFVRSSASGLVSNDAWFGMVLPQQIFPGELSWVTNNSTIAYGFASTNGATNLNVYPGHFGLNWDSSNGLTANRSARPTTVFNWAAYSMDSSQFVLFDDIGSTQSRHAIYEFPQGLSSTLMDPIPVVSGSNVTVRLSGFDLNGDAIGTVNWSFRSQRGGSVSFANVARNSGFQTVDMVFTPPRGFSGPLAVEVFLNTNGSGTVISVPFIVAVPSYTLASNSIVLTENSTDTLRNNQLISNINIPAFMGTTHTLDVQWQVRQSGDPVFSAQPAPVVSFSTNTIATTNPISVTPKTADLYFSIAPDRTGTATLTLQLTDLNNLILNQQTILVQVQPMADVAPVIAQTSTSIQNLIVQGGRLYANSVSSAQAVTSFAAEARALGGHLLNINTAEELVFIRSSGANLLTENAWIGMTLPQVSFPGELSWITNDSTIAYGYASTDGVTNLNVYPGHYDLTWHSTNGLIANRTTGRATLSNWAYYLRSTDRYFLLNDSGDRLARYALYEFPQGLAPASIMSVPVVSATTATVRLTGFDLNGDSLGLANWSGVASAGTINFNGVTQNLGHQTVDMVYTAPANYSGQTTAAISLQVNGKSSTTVISFIVDGPPNIALSTQAITLAEDFGSHVIGTTVTDLGVSGTLPFTVLASATDVVTITTSVNAIRLSALLNANGTVTLTVQSTDSASQRASEIIVVTVDAVNDPPTIIVSSDNITTSAGFSSLIIDTTATDVEDGLLTFTVQLQTTNVISVTTTANAIIINPIVGRVGQTTLIVRTADRQGQTDVQLIAVNVAIVGSATTPVISVSTSLIRVQEDFTTAVTFITTATDADGDAVVFSLSSSERLFDAVLSTRTGGVSTITLTSVANAFGTATLTVHATDVGGQITSTEVLVVVNAVNDDPLSFRFSTSMITLSAPGNQLERNIQSISINNPDTANRRAQWQLTLSGDPIFSANPTPVVSFTTNALATTATLTSAQQTAQLYFSIAPNQTGTGIITLQLTDLTRSEMSQQILTVQLNSVDRPPMITQGNPNLRNLIVHGGHLYANSVASTTLSVSPFLTEARSLGGHLININTIEEMNFVRSTHSGLEPHDAWFGMVLPRRTFPGELSWVTHDSTIAYGFATTNGVTNLTVYPGHYALTWNASSGLVANSVGRPSTVFNWTIYDNRSREYYLVDDGGDAIIRRSALYEFPQGLAQASINTIPVRAGSSATVRLTGADLNGDAISIANWSAVATTDSFSFANVAQSSGVQTVDLIYTPSINYNGLIRADVVLQVNGLMTTRSLSFYVGSATPTFTLASSTIVLTQNSAQTIRNQQPISNARIPAFDGLTGTLDVQWRVTHSGDAIFSANPAPVVSFTTHVLTTTDRIGSTAQTAQLYFTIAPDRVGTATLTVQLSNQITSGMSQQTLVVQVNPMSPMPPTIVPLNTSIDNLVVNGGRLYANSFTQGRRIVSFVAESRSFGGHLLNINTIEELTFLNSAASGLILNESWYGLVLPQRVFPGELSWVTHDSTIGYGFVSTNNNSTGDITVYPGHFILNWNSARGLIASREGNSVFNWTIYADGLGYFLLDDGGDSRSRLALYELPQGITPTSFLLSMRPPVPMTASSSAFVRLTGFNLNGDAISTTNWTAVDPNGGVVSFSHVSQNTGVQVVDMIYKPQADFHGLTTVVATLQVNGLSTTRNISFSVDGQPSITLSTYAITLAEDFNTPFDIGVSVTDQADGSAISFRVQTSSTEVANISTSANAIQLSALLHANGTVTLTVQATDSAGQTVSTRVVVTVQAVNDPPTLSLSTQNISIVGRYTSIIIDSTATDVEDGNLPLSVQLSSTGVVRVSTTSNTIVLRPILGGSGQTTITVSATDSGGQTITRPISFSASITSSTAPVVNVDRNLINETEDFVTPVLIQTSATDADGDDIFFSLSSSTHLVDAQLIFLSSGTGTITNLITLRPIGDLNGTTTLTIHATDVSGQSASTEIVVVIANDNIDPISFTLSTSMVTLSALDNQLERKVHGINISNIDSRTLRAQWQVTSRGDPIISANPAPIASFTTNVLSIESMLTSTTHTAQLYFSIAPDRTGTATLTVQLTDLTTNARSSQTLMVQVNPMNVAPVIAQASPNLQNLIVHGGHLYANSVASTTLSLSPFLTDARSLGGHLININTVEEHAFVYTTASGLISQESWYGLVLPQRSFPGELSWITHDSTIAYGFVSTNNNSTGVITVYPGYYPLNWEITSGLVSNRQTIASTVFNWTIYSRNIDRYFLLDEGGNGTARHALYEFPQGLAPVSNRITPINVGSTTTVRLTGFDLNGDAISVANWRAVATSGSVSLNNIAQSSGVHTVDLVYIPPSNFSGLSSVDLSLLVDGLRTTASLSFAVSPATPTFTVPSSTLVLTQNSAQTIRNQQPINSVRISAYDGQSSLSDVQWRVMHSGDPIFSTNPTPVVSFTTNVLTTTGSLGATTQTAQLYFTIAPDRIGTATLTIQLTNLATSVMSQQTLVVQVNPMSNVPPTIVPINSSIDNLVVNAGRLYANSRTFGRRIVSFVADSRSFGGHLLNINTIEELTFLNSAASGLILDESWYGLVLPQESFPGELSWVTHDSTIGYGFVSTSNNTTGDITVYPGHFILNWNSARGLIASREGNSVFNWTIYADSFGYFLLNDVGDSNSRLALYELPQGISPTSLLLSMRSPVIVAARLSATVRLTGFDLNGDAISTTNWTAVDPNGGVTRFSNISQNTGVQVVDMVYTAPANFNSDTTVVATLQVNGLTTTRAILFTPDRPPNIALSTQVLTLAEDFSTMVIGTTVTDQIDFGNLPFTVRASTSGIVNVSNLGYGIRLSAVENASGQVILTVSATDSAPQTVSTLVVVTVKAVNDPPIIDVSTDNISTVGGFGSITIGTTATDVEDVTLPFTVQLSTTNIVSVTTATNAIVLTPIVGGSGRTTLTVLATDSSGQTTLRAIAVDVAIVQSTPPVLIVSTNLIRVQEDFTPSVVIQSTATDADGGTLTIFVRSSTNLVNVAESGLVNDQFSITLTPMINLHGTTTITVDVFDSGGLSASEQIVVIVNSVRDPVSFAFSTPVVNLTGNQLDRNIQRINILNPERETLRAQWLLTSSGDPIFSINPTPVLSFSTNTLTNVTNIATIDETAQLYFSIAPNRVGTATLTAQLTNLTTTEMSQQTLVVQVNPTDVAPMIIQTSTRIENLIVNGGRLYANSINTAPGVTTFLTEAKALGGHLINFNTTEEHTFMRSTASGLMSNNAWIGMVLPQLEFPGELSWVTHDSTIVYGHASTDGRDNLRVYPGHLALRWQLHTGLFANRGSSRPSVFNWANYSRNSDSYFLIGDRGDGTSRRALYEFPQGLAPTSIMPRPIRRDGLSATVRLTGFDLNGDAINVSNWSGTDPNGGTVRFSQVSQRTGVQTVDMIYTAPANFNDHTTVVVTLTVNGLISTTALSFFPIVPSFTLTTSTIILVENSSQTIRNQQFISNIEIPAYSGTTSSLEYQWSVSQSGDTIFSNKPAPVVSFSTNVLTTRGQLSSTARTAHLYFSIAPDRKGRATLTVHLSSVTKPAEISEQTIVVQVNPMNDVPIGFGVSTDLQNLILRGGRLYANSVKTARSVNPFLEEARALGGHLANINTIEEFEFINSTQNGLITQNAWFGLSLPQLEFPGELFWVTNDSTIAYGFSRINGNDNINVYPGHYNIPWFSLFANRGSSRPSVFNWIHYSAPLTSFVLIGDRGDATYRHGLYEFPQGLASPKSIPVLTSSSVTVRLTVFDLNGDAINLSNLSAIATSGTVSIGNILQSTGLQTIEMVYTAPANFVSQSTVVVSLQVNGSSTSTELSFVPSVPTFTLPSNLIVLTANSSQTIRNTQQISNIEIAGLAGTTRNLNVQWTVTNSGNAIFPTRPAPVVSFSTNANATNVNLSTTARTAQLYFTVAPDRTGIATLTLELSNAELGIRSSQTMVVQVNPMINEPPVIVPTNPNFANIRLYGGHLYAHSVTRSQAIAPFLAEARAYGGHLANTNSSEEFNYFLSLIRSGISAIDYSWHGLVLPQQSFPGELSWVTNDSTIAYGFAIGDGISNLTTYPGQYRLLWNITTGVIANKPESQPSVFNWVYFADIVSNYYSLLGERGDTRARHGFYEFPQGIRVSSPTALVSVNGGANATLSFTGYDLNGDAINTANWSGTDPNGGTVRFGGVYQSAGVHTVNMTYTAPTDFDGLTTVVVTLQAGGLSTTIAVPFIVNGPPTIALSSHAITLDEDFPAIVIGTTITDRVDGNNLPFSIRASATGMVTITTSTNTIRLSSVLNANGRVTLTVQAADSLSLTTSALIVVNIRPVSDTPTITVSSDNITTLGGFFPITIQTIVTDIEDGTVPFTVQASTPGVVAVNIFDDAIVLSPIETGSGQVTLTITAVDSSNTVGIETIIVNVIVTPSATPVLTVSTNRINVLEDFTQAIFIRTTATDESALVVTVSSFTRLVDAAFSTQGISLSAATNLFGTTTLTVRATDVGGMFDSTEIVVVVESVNDTPTISISSQSIVLASAVNVAPVVLTVSAADVEDATLTITASTGQGVINTTLTNTSLSIARRGLGDNGPIVVLTVTATDSDGGIVSTRVTVEVPPVFILTLGIKTIDFAWSRITTATHYRLQSNPNGSAGYVDISTTGIVITPNSTDIRQTTAQALVSLHRYIFPSLPDPMYAVNTCNAAFCDTGFRHPEVSLNNGQLQSLIGRIKGGFEEEFGEGGNIVNHGLGARFGESVSISDDGNTLAVGAPLEDGSFPGINGQLDNKAPNSGAVFLFRRNGSLWTRQAYIKASNLQASDQFGSIVRLSLDGNTLAVGASLEDGVSSGVNNSQANGITNSGAVYIFRFSGGVWAQQAYIKASNPQLDGAFGYAFSLSADGNTLAVGARGEDGSSTGVNGMQDTNTPDSGAVYIFQFGSGVWAQQAYIKASNTGQSDLFGESVSLNANGNTLAVGAPDEASASTGVNGAQNDNRALGSGAVYVYRLSGGGAWSQQAYIKASNSQGGDRFGHSVSLSVIGNTLAVGAPFEDGLANSLRDSGAVYVYQFNGVWSQQAYIKASNIGRDDQFGRSISLSGDGSTLAVGSHLEDGSATGVKGGQNDNTADSGAAYVFEFGNGVWLQQAYVKSPATFPGQTFGYSVSLSRDGSVLAVGETQTPASGISIGEGEVYLY